MDKRRFGLALFAALGISITITGLFYIRVRNQQPQTTRHVIAASVTLAAGTPIAAENLKELRWPDGVSVEGLIERKEDVVGRIPAFPIAAGEPVLKRDLASGASLGLAAKIPDGMRAAAVKTNEINNVAGFIFPGSHVDVLTTLRGPTSMFTRTVLQNVQVLSTGSRIEPDPNGKPENVSVITVLTTPEQSEKLALAETQGSIRFVLRNNGDAAVYETPDVNLADIEPAQAPPPAVVKRVTCPKGRCGGPALISYSVETVAAGKSNVATFKEPASPGAKAAETKPQAPAQ